MRVIPIVGALISFAIVMFFIPRLIKYLRNIGLVVKDQNKQDKPLIPVSAGLVVVGGVIGGLMSYVFIQTFFYKDSSPLLTAAAAIPLMVVNAGNSIMWFPFIGEVNFGLIYPLILIPLIFIGSSNMVNILAGFNGLEAGLGLIYIGNLGLYAYLNNRPLAALIAAVTFESLLAFYYYNKYPAKIFPGDSLTYFLGASLATIAIVGNIEKAALIISIPFFIEFFLQA